VPKSIPPRWRRELRRRVRHVRRSPVLWWTVAAVLALVTASSLRSSFDRAAAAEARFGVLRPVLVVARPVGVGEVVEAGDVRLEPRPLALLPEGAVSGSAVVAGRVAVADLVPGEVVVSARLAPGGRRGAAALLPPGQRALAVPGGAGRPPLRPGDRVDVLATGGDGDGDGGSDTLVVVTDATVLDVDDQRDLVTIAVAPDEAPLVASAVATATVTLALSG
jgi:pilus assembly protein CpaB